MTVTMSLTANGQLEAIAFDINNASAANAADGLSSVSASARDDALSVLQALVSRGVLRQLPDVGLGTDGSLGLLFANDDQYVYLDFTTHDNLHYYVRVRDRIVIEALVDRSMGYEPVAASLQPFLLIESSRTVSMLSWHRSNDPGFVLVQTARERTAQQPELVTKYLDTAQPMLQEALVSA